MNAVPHILVADTVFRSLDWGETARAHMAVGAIAPDAYRIIAGLSFRDLHFRGRRGSKVQLRDFADTYVIPALARGQGDEQAFWAGWYCHLVSDRVWRRMLRTELPDLWQAVTSGDREERARVRDGYQAACDRVDVQLADAPGSTVAELRWLLRSWQPGYELGLVKASQMREWVVQVGSNAMPPPEPTLVGRTDVDFAFVQRAIAAAQQQLAKDMANLARQADESPDFDGPFAQV